MARLTTTRDFKSKLTTRTRDGEPWIMGTPFAVLYFNSDEKPFYGKIKNGTFYLTNNSVFAATGSIIEGSFIDLPTYTKVEYEIRTMRIPRFWIRFVPLIGVILSIAFVINNPDIFLASFIFGVIIFFGLLFLLAIWGEKRRLKKLEKQFNDEFDLVATDSI